MKLNEIHLSGPQSQKNGKYMTARKMKM